MEAYNKAIDMKGVMPIMPIIKKAICYGFVAKNDKKN
jgi:hypothetical protein